MLGLVFVNVSVSVRVRVRTSVSVRPRVRVKADEMSLCHFFYICAYFPAKELSAAKAAFLFSMLRGMSKRDSRYFS